jgi:hypothetical protein
MKFLDAQFIESLDEEQLLLLALVLIDEPYNVSVGDDAYDDLLDKAQRELDRKTLSVIVKWLRVGTSFTLEQAKALTNR